MRVSFRYFICFSLLVLYGVGFGVGRSGRCADREFARYSGLVNVWRQWRGHSFQMTSG
jgi:hypothetical protein